MTAERKKSLPAELALEKAKRAPATTAPFPLTRPLTIIAQDPSVRRGRKILTACVDVPAEILAPGPRGYRVHVIDYDASSDVLYKPKTKGLETDQFKEATSLRRLVGNPAFHAQNVYAIVMKTLARFEFALGRRIGWGFGGHQLKIAPHAFADANAFYSNRDEALAFGYFPGERGTVFSCLSHDVVAHETTHALVDGLRKRYSDPSSPDQAAFHEGFADIVALLSIFSLPEVLEFVISGLGRAGRGLRIPRGALTADRLRDSVLFGLAEEMGREMIAVRGDALRRSVKLLPSAKYLDTAEYEDSHRRGEILSAAIMNAFLLVWEKRLDSLEKGAGSINRKVVAEEGAAVADTLLTMAIRALDYAPPVHLLFGDFLSGILTADREIRPVDPKYHFRDVLRGSFASYGIVPTSPGDSFEEGIWLSPEQGSGFRRRRRPKSRKLRYERTHYEEMRRDPDEVFRFIWENRESLDIYEPAYSEVQSVRPCLRLAPDGFALRETVVEYLQILDVLGSELTTLGIERPADMSGSQEIRLYGGGTLIFDDYGRLKFHIHNRVHNAERQSRRLSDLWRFGYFRSGASAVRRFAQMHRMRAVSMRGYPNEEW